MGILKIEDIEKLDKNFLTAEDAARALQISITTFYRHLEKWIFRLSVTAGRYISRKSRFWNFCGMGKAKKTDDLDFQPVELNMLKIRLNEGRCLSADTRKRRKTVQFFDAVPIGTAFSGKIPETLIYKRSI